MKKSTKQEEIDFLKGYVEFSPKARVLEAKALWGMAEGLEPSDERAILFLIAIESFFMQQETLYKFLKATKAASLGKDFLSVIQTTNFNPEQDMSKLFSSEDLAIEYPPGISEEEIAKVREAIDNIVGTCRKLIEANKAFSSVYYILKHGFLVYKDGQNVMALMHEEKEKRFTDFLQKNNIKGEKNSLYENNFDYVVDLNERVAYAIQDIIAIRLLQLGVSKL